MGVLVCANAGNHLIQKMMSDPQELELWVGTSCLARCWDLNLNSPLQLYMFLTIGLPLQSNTQFLVT